MLHFLNIELAKAVTGKKKPRNCMYMFVKKILCLKTLCFYLFNLGTGLLNARVDFDIYVNPLLFSL